MVNTSVVFDGDIDERSLDRTVDKVDKRLNEAGEIDVDASTGGMGMNAGPGTDMGGLSDPLNEMNNDMGGLRQSMDDKLPSSIPAAGGIASKALPIAIAGGVGAGLFKAMSSASGSLSATLSMFGTAMDLFFKPFGDFLGDKLRPMATGLIDMARQFNDIAENEGLAVAVTSMGADVVSSIASSIGESALNIATGEWDAKDLITIGLSTWGAAKIIGISMGTWGAGSLIGIGSKAMFGAGSLLGISSTMPVAAAALITIGASVWAADQLIDISKGIDPENLFSEAGEEAAVKGDNNPLRSDETDPLDPSAETGVIDPRNVPILSEAFEQGQRVRDELLTRQESRQETMDEVPGSGLGGAMTPGVGQGAGDQDVAGSDDIQNVEQKLDRLIGEIQGLDLSAVFSIGEREFAELVREAQQTTQSGRDPMQNP